MLRDVIATGELSFDKVSSELKDSGNTIDAEIASDVEKAIAAKATPHTQMVKKNGMACSKSISVLWVRPISIIFCIPPLHRYASFIPGHDARHRLCRHLH